MLNESKLRAKMSLARQEKLLNALAEQLKLPLVRIARRAELAQTQNNRLVSLASIELTADSALKLIDNYLLSLKLAQQQNGLQLEPVSVSAILTSAAHELSKIAKERNLELELSLSGKYEPVMAHRAGLEAVITSLGYVFIDAETSIVAKKRPIVTLAAHRSKLGIVTGMFAESENFGTELYKNARKLGAAKPDSIYNLAATNGTGVFVADSLLEAMSAKLRVAHHHKLTGLAATFAPSRQLSLV